MRRCSFHGSIRYKFQKTAVYTRLYNGDGSKTAKINHKPRTRLTVDSSELTFLSSSKSSDTKTKPNIRNPAQKIDIVP